VAPLLWLLWCLGFDLAATAVVPWLQLGCYGCGALLVAGSGLAVVPWLLRWLGCCGSFASAAVVPCLWLLWCLGFNLAATAVVPWLQLGCYGCGALLAAGSGLAVGPWLLRRLGCCGSFALADVVSWL
jgi:hypothetical protein